MKYVYTLLISLVCLTSFSQGTNDLTAEDRAYLFHIVKKSPILDNSIGRYFEYSGPLVRLMNKELNYDSIESYIINNPNALFIRKGEIEKSPKGIIAEAANKMALWELNKVLLASRQSENDLERYRTQYNQFETLLKSKLPASALKSENGNTEIQKKILAVLNPSLSFDDKAAMLATFHFLSVEDQLVTLEAMNYATNAYVEKRAYGIFLQLGGTATTFKNILIAAGDGSETSGLLNEREKDENGRWNKGLPKAIGLFPYEAKIIDPSKRNKTALEPVRMPVIDFETVGENKLTQLHFDVWGYNSKKQTTVVIERNGLSYHLFGSNDTRFLSPDSTYSNGKTFQAVINELEKDKIAKLWDKIYGKKGYDYEIETAKRKKDETEKKINEDEHKYSNMTQGTITTSSRVPGSVKRAKKKALKKTTGGEFNAQPKTDSDKKARKKEQEGIIYLYGEYERYKKIIAELEIEKKAAIDLLAIYQRRLDNYKSAMGYHWVDFTEKDGLYTFSDSSTFDLYTQEFTFKADTLKTPFEVRLIAIPDGPLSDNADEVMLHVNLADSKPGFDARVQLNLLDQFESNKWNLDNPLFHASDSVSIRQFFEALLDKKLPFEVISRGQGVGKWNGTSVVRSADRTEWNSYQGGTDEERLRSKMDSSNLRLRSTQVNIFLNRGILLEINTFTDPVKTNLKAANESIQNELNKYHLSGNDYLSALRTATVIQKLKTELNVLAGTYLSREDAKIVIDRLNKQLEGVKVSCGPTSFKWQELLNIK
ncbi:hypothetical protein [Fluviicola chungangensis]|uniref:Uncharacterized protein n=1 Tax=Fluviicola chungangensis TaxID=2597671 RepID=A0A556MR02_9FLAO|nr:hypothetical protein [Fluviicola chungangensis]TSJ42272.1 hypothetical protein FO442_10920 [Fluviicola chungangensis]